MNSSCTGAMDATSPLRRQKARQSGGRRSGVAKVIRWPMARGVGYSEILNDALFEARQHGRLYREGRLMELRKPVPGNPSIKVQVFMPASVYQRRRQRERTDRTGSCISRLCEGALRELECAPAPAPAALP